MKRFLPTVLCLFLAMSACESANKPAATPTAQTPEERTRYAALLARANALLARDDNTPGREFVNRLRTEPNPEILALMAKPEAIPEDKKWRVNEIENTLKNAEAGQTWPKPPLVQVPRAGAPVKVDGVIDPAEWQGAVSFDRAFIFNTKDEPTSQKTRWKMMWDDQYLYVAYDCDDIDLQAAQQKQDDPVYGDDCVELFISPDIRFRSYWEIVGNINDVIFDSLECKKATMWGCDLNIAQNVDGLKFSAKNRGTVNKPDDKDEGYTAEMALPWSALLAQGKTAAQPKDVYHFMLVRVDKNAKSATAYSFHPLLGWGHNIWNMAKMELLPAK